FFAPVRVAGRGKDEMLAADGTASARHPRTGATVFAHALGEQAPAKLPPGDRREELARWLAAPATPWFARNLAHPVCAHFAGRGLRGPAAAARDTTPPSNPELLDALAKHLVESKYDVKALIRLITSSRTSQLSSRPNATNTRDGQNSSRALFRRLPAEVLLD